MTNPSKKTPKVKTRQRRSANMKMTIMAAAVCPQCKSTKTPHVACRVCGTYKGRQVLKIKSKTKKKEEEKK